LCGIVFGEDGDRDVQVLGQRHLRKKAPCINYSVGMSKELARNWEDNTKFVTYQKCPCKRINL
jgi:hypothetical protein